MMAVQHRQDGMPVAQLLDGMAAVAAGQDVAIAGLALDSRRARPGDLFLAVDGVSRHGAEYAAEAVSRGAVAVCWEPNDELDAEAFELGALDVPVIAVPELGRRVSILADRFYGEPSASIFTVGVTGTDGKTSCTHLLAQALHEQRRPCGLIGTLGAGVYGALRDSGHTTPDPIGLQRELDALRSAGAAAVVMEVSSHALDQARTDGVHFDVAVLTHVSRDHLDYHGSEHAYRRAKARLFDSPSLQAGVLNADDALGRELLARPDVPYMRIAYALDEQDHARQADRYVIARSVETAASGLRLELATSWGEGRLNTALLGRFNAGNLLAVLAVLLYNGMDLDTALARLARTRTVPGRMETLHTADGTTVVIDYAHTPGALEQVLLALRAHCAGELWCVFGAGGERDTGKRPLMGAVAERHADRVVLTNDNPRHEDPAAIIGDILAGMQHPGSCRVEPDRRAAIEQVLRAAGPEDVVLIAGKGHEEYQLIGDQRLVFSDQAVVLQWSREAGA